MTETDEPTSGGWVPAKVPTEADVEFRRLSKKLERMPSADIPGSLYRLARRYVELNPEPRDPVPDDCELVVMTTRMLENLRRKGAGRVLPTRSLRTPPTCTRCSASTRPTW